MKIIISENKVEQVKKLIELKGVKTVVKLLGGFDNLIKIVGEDDMYGYIKSYLNEVCIPDYGWMSHSEYKKEVEDWIDIPFNINDEDEYRYFKEIYDDEEDEYEKSELVIYYKMCQRLNKLFGDKWILPFKDMFEDNTGLEVQTMSLSDIEIKKYNF